MISDKRDELYITFDLNYQSVVVLHIKHCSK